MPDENVLRGSLEEQLALEPAGEDAYHARLPGFGGVTLGCAALAAARSCEERALHSLYLSFLRPVPPDSRVLMRVERVSDGRRFARRRVIVLLDGRRVSEGVASFAAPGSGPELQESVAPDLPPPESLPTDEQVARDEGWEHGTDVPFTWRWIGRPWDPEPGDPSRYVAWVRPRVPLLDDRPLRAAALAYLSDFHSHFSVARLLRGYFDTEGFVSLDQVLWVHRDLPWDDWWSITTECDVGHGGRALTRRSLFASDGRLVASMAQEALIPGAAAAPG